MFNFTGARSAASAATVYVVRSSEEHGVHRVLVLDSGRTGWRDGDLRTVGELVEGRNDRRLA